MSADSAVRECALDTSASFLVQAPAGSGKTELLIQRYLKLLETAESPGSIVAVTFTRKAAAEVRFRVLDALRSAKQDTPPETPHRRITYEISRRVLERDRAAGWDLLHNPAQMRIETIDALCIAITSRMPWVSRFGSMPEFSEKAEDLYRQATRATLRDADSGNEALASLLLHLDNDFSQAALLIEQMLEKRDQWLRLTGADPDFVAVRRELETALQELIVDQLRDLRAAFDSGTAEEIAYVLGLPQFPGARIEDMTAWTEVASLLLTGEGKWRQTLNVKNGFPTDDPRKPRALRLLSSLRGNEPMRDALKHFRRLPAPHFEDTQWSALESIVSVLTLAAAKLQVVFQEQGRVDFTELAIRASDALGRLEEPTDLALTLGHRIQHILVDEFQDTSYTQYELIRKLTAGWEPGEGRTLFLVGDPMQSIYRFRQAEVELFLKAGREGIGAIPLETLTLTVNFRSSERIVGWVNDTFAQIMPAQADPDSGAVTYSPCVANDDGSRTVADAVAARAFLSAADEARHVIDLVKDADGKTAVLVRARSHLTSIVAALKQNGIRFQAIEIDELGRRPVIQDLLALTLALLHPADRISWLAILRAPWCGLTLDDLHRLAGKDHDRAVWDLLRDPGLELSSDGTARVHRILPVLEQAIAERGRRPLREWVEGAWFALGGPACVEDDTALEDASAYFDLLDQLSEGADLADFDWFRAQVDSLFAQPDPRAGDRLQLMTIHKAKGLEFDSVILPGLSAPPKPDDRRLLRWLEQAGRMLIAPISESGESSDPTYEYIRHMEQRKLDHEGERLLYVAATRARERLHLLAVVQMDAHGSVADPPAKSFLKLLWPSMAETFRNAAATQNVEPPAEPHVIRRVPEGWSVPAPPRAVEWVRRDLEILEQARPSFEWVSDRLRHAGTALHGVLQRVAREGLDAWDETAVRQRRHAYQSVLANLGVSPDDLAECSQRVETGLLRTLRDDRGRWILARHAEHASEQAVSGLIDGKLCEGVIDRTFVDEAGVRWIIDFKTSAHEGGDLEAFLDSEQHRYREQLERYARLIVQQDDRPIRLGLYFPLLGGWREWAAPVVLRRQASLFDL